MINKLPLTTTPRKWLSVIAAVLVLYTVGGFFLLPAVLRHILPGMIRDATGRDGGVTAVTFNPFQMRLHLQGFELKEKNGQAFTTFAGFEADFNVWHSLRKGLLSFAEIRLLEPVVHLERHKNGALNIDDLFAAAPEAEKSAIPPFEVGKLQLLDGGIHWRDAHYAQPVSETVQPLNLEISDLVTSPDSDSVLNISLALKSGAKLEWSGKLGLNPLRSDGHIHIQGLQTRQLWDLFWQDNAKYTLNKGINEIDTQYRLGFNGAQLHVALAPLKITVNGFGMDEKGEATALIQVQTALLQDARLDAQWLTSNGHWQAKIPQGQVVLKDFRLADPGAQKQRFEAGDFALQGLSVELVNNETLQLNVGHQKIDVKNTAFALHKERPFQVSAAAIAVGPARFAARQAKPGSNLAFTAEQDSVTLQKLTLSLPASRETLLDVAETAIGKVRMTFQPKDNAAPQIQVSQDSFTAKGFVLRESGKKEPLAEVMSASMQGVQFDLDKKLLKITAAASSGADLKAWLDSDGTLNYQTLFAAKKPPKTAVPPPAEATPTEIGAEQTPLAPAEPWTVAVDKLQLDNGAVSFQDLSRQPPATFKLAAMAGMMENFNSANGAKFPLQFSALFNGNGKIQLKGIAAIQPFIGSFDIDIAQFPLQPFQPYINPFARLEVLAGELRVDGKLALDLRNAKQPQVSFNGGTGISGFQVREQQLHQDLARWEEFALRGIAFDLQPLRFSVAEIAVDRPYLRVAINKDGTVNLGEIAVKQPQTQKNAAVSKAETASASPAPVFKIKQINLREGHADFSDHSLIIPFAAHIDHLGGGVQGLSSASGSETSLLLQGKVLDLAPVSIGGTFKPYQGEYKIDLDFHGLPMPAATPYIAEFAGYKIEKGQMDLQLDYAIAKGRLNARNKILIDQLTLGDKVASPRAVSLPLGLAIALLKDASGKINIDFPISGSLEDPQFSIGHLIGDALLNVVVKTVTSPFRAIAALLGSDDEDMGRIEFKPGSYELAAAEIEKLDGLAKVFAERTVLKLELKGIAYQQEDWPELTDEALLEQLRARHIEELRKNGEIPEGDNLELPEKDYRRLLADMFIAKFPQLGKRSLFGTPKLVNEDKSDFYAVAKQKLCAGMAVDPQLLHALAQDRSQAIARYLLEQKGLARNRVFILDAKVEPQAPKSGVALELSLRGS